MSHGLQPHKWAVSRGTAFEIRGQYHLRGLGYRELMELYKVSYGTIQQIVAGTHPAVKGHPSISRGRGSGNAKRYSNETDDE